MILVTGATGGLGKATINALLNKIPAIDFSLATPINDELNSRLNNVSAV